MRLLVVSSWFPFPPDNGSKLRAFHLLGHLARQHRLTLLTFAEPGEERQVGGLGALCERVQTVAGNPFKAGRLATLPLFSGVPRSYAQTYSVLMQRFVDAEVHRHDGVIALQLGASLYLVDRPEIPRVLDEVEVSVIRDKYVGQPWSVSRTRRGLTWWKYSRFVRHLVSRFERTTVVSDVERAHLAEIGCDLTKVRVVPNGVVRSALSHTADRRPGQLVYSGSITYFANLDAVQHFVDAILATIQATRPDATLIVTGSTGDIDIGRLSSDKRVVFTGHVADVKSVVASSTVCVVPLRLGGGTRLKILEAMALGTPVVSTSKGAEGLAVSDGVDILIADSPADFAAAVLRVLSEPALRERLTRNARALVERLYTWDRVGVQLDAVLDEAIDARRLEPSGGGVRAARA